MMASDDRRIALEFKQRLGTLARVLELRAFGSRARGDAAAGSDLDIFLVVDRIDADLREKISELAWEVGFENNVVLCTFVVTVEQLKYGPVGVSPIIRQIEKEGVRL